MAEYLDNDEDGNVDDQLKVLDKMLENKAFMVMWKNENDLDNIACHQVVEKGSKI